MIETFYDVMHRQGIRRRRFLKFCSLTAAAMGLGPSFAPKIVHAMESTPRIWVIPLFGQSRGVHTWRHLGMWYILNFVIAHIYVAVREDSISRQSPISTMISGWRMVKDSRDVDDGH